jgi:hypothetical protein
VEKSLFSPVCYLFHIEKGLTCHGSFCPLNFKI